MNNTRSYNTDRIETSRRAVIRRTEIRGHMKLAMIRASRIEKKLSDRIS